MHTVIELPPYLAAAKAAGMTAQEMEDAVFMVASDPQGGDIIQGTGGCRKYRLAGRGKGKSGGYRIITVFGGRDMPVFMLTVFGKGQKDNLSRAERNELAIVTRNLIETYHRRRR
ncbi:type II toxin-antitoxin system RelE/ParE family toxin [Mesorhizobium sp. LHD-90]|uniref:type II toxin-antitoxin system RelE/ParE family toxin n=1 Tax=Mesorhizobium sp. LHD-90 TaxID=3071414 RepID=UPI0027E0C48D|nr:type II toxin-antitoxin system RelE/ParE family toxin [Mesorhizobium sp. LHD-90]MDQ6436506.1 type II toxin-antitoxin system RelE/ParE family toxin [Mesorhizobium sp. LHD-90]